MLTIHTDTLTARQLYCLGPLLPPHRVDTHDHTIAVNPAECPHREALIAWLNATAPVYWYDGTAVPVERRHIAKGRPGRTCSCALALALHDATGEQWDVGRSRCHTYRPDRCGRMIRRDAVFGLARADRSQMSDDRRERSAVAERMAHVPCAHRSSRRDKRVHRFFDIVQGHATLGHGDLRRRWGGVSVLVRA